MSSDWGNFNQDNNPTFDDQLKVVSFGLENSLADGLKAPSDLSLPWAEAETLNQVLQTAEALQASDLLMRQQSELPFTLHSENSLLVGELDSLTSQGLATRSPIIHQANPIEETVKEQLLFLKLKGATDLTYEGEVTVKGIETNAFQAPTHLQGQETEIVASLLESLNRIYDRFNIVFTVELPPPGSEYSTIYIGGNGDAFKQYGSYLGLAEKIDKGNQDKSDIAFVFTENLPVSSQTASEYGEMLAYYIAHETGHLLGFEHEHPVDDTTDPLAEVAFKPYTHVEIAKDVLKDLEDGMLSIAGQNYSIHPKILNALKNHPDSYYAGTVGPDAFPDLLMGQSIIHAEQTGTWLTRVLDMAWQAQNDSSFTDVEKSQILAWSYGMLTHAAGDHWAHTLVNEFAEGVFPSFGELGESANLANAIRHFLVEGYIEDATEGFDNNPDRTLFKGDVSDDSTPGIAYAAPIRFIYETLIRPVPFDPTLPEGSRNEQPLVQGKRGLAIDTFLNLRNKLETTAKSRGPHIELGPIVADIIDKLVTGTPIPETTLKNLYTAYLYNWVDNIDQGLRHWPEFGLAFTKAFFDAQSRRDLQNKIGEAYGEDTVNNTLRGDKENDVGVLDVMFEELDDPDGNGSTKDSFINNHLLPMFGLPREFGVMRSVLQDFGTALDNAIIKPLKLAINPILVGIDKLEESVKDFLKKQIEEKFGFDFKTFEFLTDSSSKMDLASIKIGDAVIPVFKPGDREKLDAYLGLTPNDHNPLPSGTGSLPIVTFYPGAVGGLKDDANFSKTGFAAYVNSVTLSKILLLHEDPVDSQTTGTNGLSQLFSNILTAQNSGTPVTYDASLLNLNGNHGGNILTTTLPGIDNSKPWLTSIDTDHAWREDSLTTTTALFHVNTDGASNAIWQTNVTSGDYTVQTTWLANVTQPNLSPASNATYKIYDGSTLLGTVIKDQRVFSTDAEDGGLSFTNLGQFRINSGTLRVELLTSGNGNEIAGPMRIVSTANNTLQRIQLLRDPETLAITPNGYSETGTGWVDLKYSTGKGNFPLWESEILRPVYRELFTDWQNSQLQFPALGDATSADPNNGGPDNNALPTHATAFSPDLPENDNSIPISDSVKDLIIKGLDDLVQFVDRLEKSQPFTITLPIVNKTLAEILKLQTQVSETLRNPVQEYFKNDTTPTFAELFEVVGDSIVGRINSISPILEFDLDINKIIALNDFPLELENLKNIEQVLGIDPELNTTVDFLAVLRLFDQQNQELPKFTVGIDLSSNDELKIEDRVFLKANRAIIDIDVAASNLNFDLNFENFLNPSIENGEVFLDGNVEFSDPNSNGRISFSELDDLIPTLSPSGTLDVTLPIHINNIYKKEILTITIDDNNIFDSTPPKSNIIDDKSTNEIDESKSFLDQLSVVRKINLDNLEYIIQEIGSGIQDIAKNLNPNTGIPFLDRGIEELVEFSSLLSDLSRNLAEKSIIGTKEINTNGVKLSGDASFKLRLNNNTPIEVIIQKENIDNNQTLDDLVADVNSALKTAGIGNDIEAVTRNKKLILRTVNFGDTFTLNSLDDIAKNSFGFTAGQEATLKLLKLTDILTLEKLPNNKVALNVDLNKTLEKPINLDFQESVETGIGDLKFIGNVDGNFTAKIDLDLGIIVDLNLIGSNFELTEKTLLSKFNGGRGINSATGDDIRITLKDGTTKTVNFDGDLTVNDAINSIKSIFGNKVSIEFDNSKKLLNLNDNTNGNGEFSITAINDSLAAGGLNISGINANGSVQGIKIGNDVKITLKDKTVAEVNFDGDLTVGDVINSIKNVFGNKVTVEIDNKNKSLNLVDNTIGDGEFSITAINNSLAGWGLGILGHDSDGSLRGIKIGDDLQLGKDLEKLEEPELEILISKLNDKSGIRIIDNSPDLKVGLKDGNVFSIDFKDTHQTVGSIINVFQTATNGKITASISNNQKGLNIVDNTTGDKTFIIEPVNGSLAGYDLGILGSSFAGVIQGISIGNGIVNETALSSLNMQKGVEINNNQVNWQIKLRDGSSYPVKFPITKDSTLQDIIDAIESATKSGTQNKVDVIVDQTTKGIHLIDKSTGSQTFQVTATDSNGIILGEDLGILVSSISGIIQGKTLSSNAETQSLSLTTDTNVFSLNTGKGIRVNQVENTPDLHINLRDGSTLDINLVITETTSLGNVINQINLAANGKVIFGINEQESGLIIRDNTTGNYQFTIVNTQESFAATDLGINDISASTVGIIVGNSINQILDENTQLSIINEINNQTQNKFSDLAFNLKDGTYFEVDFQNSDSEIYLQQIINEIKEASKDKNGQARVLIGLNEERTGLVITDRTTGTNQFTVKAINNSLAGYDLGIINLESDGRIEGNSIHGDSLSKHILLDKDSEIFVDARVTSQDIDLSAALGFAKLGVEDGTADFSFTALGKLNSTEDVPLLELFEDSSILDVTYSAQGNINLPIEAQGLEVFGIQTPTNPELTIQFTSTPEDPFNYTVILSNFEAILEQVRSLANLSTDDILVFVEQAIKFLRDNNLSIFNQNIPIINKSLNDILGFLQPIQDAYDEFTGDLKELKSDLLENIADLESKLFEPLLLVKLAPNVLEKLENAFNVLEDAVKSLPTDLGEVNREIPQDLIYAVNLFSEIVNQLPNAAITDLINQLEIQVNALPNSISQEAKNKLVQVINTIEANPNLVESYFDDLKIAITNLLDPVLSINLSSLLTVSSKLEINAIALIQDVSKLLNTLNTSISDISKLNLVDNKRYIKPLTDASQKIATAINEVNLTSLEDGLNDLTKAIANFPIPELGLGLNEVLSNLRITAIAFTKDLPQLLSTLNTTITNLANSNLVDTTLLTQANQKTALAIREFNFTKLEEGLEQLTEAIRTLPTPELSQIFNQFETILGKLSLNIVRENINEIQQRLLGGSNIGQLLFNLFDLDLPSFKSEIQPIYNNLNNLIGQIPNEFGQLKNSFIHINSTIQKAINEFDPVLLAKAFADLEKELKQLPQNLPTNLRNLLKTRLNELSQEFPERFSISIADNGDVIFGLDWEISKKEDVSLDFGLQNGNQRIPIDFKTEENINVEVGADLNLDFGLEGLDRVNPEPNFYLLPSTQLDLKAKFDRNNFEDNATIGGIANITLGAGNTGQFSLKNGNNLAQLTVEIDDPNNDGKVYLPEVPDSIKVNLPQGQINLYLPVKLNTKPIGLITANSDLSNLDEFSIQVPENLLENIRNAILDYDIFAGGLDAFLDRLQAILELDILKKIPFVGDEIDSANSFITKLRQEFLEPLQAILDNPEGFAREEIQQLIWDNLGPAGLNIIQDNIDPGTDRTIDDVIVNITQEELKLDLHLSGRDGLTSNFDFGFDALGLEFDAQGGINIGLGYDFRFIVGINKTEGFFFELPEGNDFTFNIDVSLANNTSLNGKLLFLEIQANNTSLNEVTKQKDYNLDGKIQDETFTTEIEIGQVTLDIRSRNGDNRITSDELDQLDFDLDLQGASATVALDLTLSLGSRDLPKIKTTLFIHTPITLSSPFGSNSETIIALYDISLNLGDFIRDTIGSVLKTVDTYIEPIKPVLDFLTSEVPIVSDLMESVGLGKFTVLDAIALYDTSNNVKKVKQVIGIVAQIVDFIDALKSLDAGNLSFGDYVIRPRPSQSGSITPQNLLAENAFALQNTTNSLQNKAFAVAPILKDLKDKLGIEFPIFNPGNIIKLILGQRADLITWDIPKLENIGFEQRFFIGPIFPPFPIYATIAARLELFANLGIGLDTRGLLETGKFLDGFYFDDHRNGRVDTPEFTLTAAFAVGAALNIQVAALGVEGGLQANFFADWNDPNRDGKVYFDELLSNARRHWLSVFDFGGELGAFFDSYVLIGFNTTIGFITIYEKRFPLYYSPLLQFGTAAETDPPQSPAEQNNIPSTLGHYSTGEGDDQGIEKGTLIIHTGRFANLRQPGASQDTAEQIYVTQLKSGALEVHSGFRPDYRQRSSDPHPTGTVQVFGDDENEAIVTKIYVDTGNGDDYIEIDDLVTANLSIYGGTGDDTIKSGINTTSYIEGGTGSDFILAGIHDDTIIGGVADPSITQKDGKDNITGNGGKDLVFGDHGKIERNSDGKIIRLESITPEKGDDDVIIVGAGDDTVIGGAGDDFISATLTKEGDSNKGDDILLGDSGTIELNSDGVTLITSIDIANGGNDTIVAGVGSDTVIGGAKNDLVTNDKDNSNDVLYGDEGYWSDEEINSLSSTFDGNDLLYGAGGNDTIIAGGGKDYLEGVAGEDILFGDHGTIELTNGTHTHLISTDFSNGGNDTLVAGLNKDFAAGGAGNDLVTNEGNDDEIFFGDQGEVTASLIQSLSAPDSDGDDTLYGQAGDDTILAGGKNDSLEGVAGEDILFGDHGKIDLEVGSVIRIESTDFANGGNDTIIAGIDKDTVIGGARNDRVTNDADTSEDVIYGDQGYWDATIISAKTDANDGDDTLYSAGANDTILAGGAKDYIESDVGLDIILGDHGIVTRNGSVVTRIETTESDSGNNDTIFAGNDDDTVFGGPGSDRITGDTNNNGDDILVGDQGYWNPTLIVSQFDATSNPDGNDTILGNGGNDTILGSDGKDYIEGNQGLDIALGDYGYIDHINKNATRITTIDVTKGNDDYLHGGDQNDTLIGGTANDSLFGGVDTGEDILLGDNGTVVNNDGSSESNDIFSHSYLYGGLDAIAGGAGNDTIIGGSGGKDTTDPKANSLTGKSGDGIDGSEGDDIAIGDNVYITRNSNEEDEKIATTFTNYGGDDYLLGSAGNDSLIAGYGKDSTSGNDGNDIIFGDNAVFDYLVDGKVNTLDLVMTTDVTQGDKDTLTGDGGNDLIFGGTQGDSISGGLGHDLVFGDHGKAEGTINLNALPLNQVNPTFTFTAIATQTADLGGNDTVRGEGGNDIILGQQGSDRLFGNEGDDDLIGGHNISGGADSGDEIDGGTGYDAIAGDNASIRRRADNLSPLIRVLNGEVIYDANGNPQITPDPQVHPKGIPGRNINLFDHSTTTKSGTYGNDTIAGGINDDLIFGQLGDDIIQGDSTTATKVSATTASVENANDGDDYIEGGGGKDLIFGNLGQDDIIGGSSHLFGNNTVNNRLDDKDTIFGGAGTKISYNHLGDSSAEGHARDADTILGDNGNIFRLVGRNGVNSDQFLTFNYDKYSNTLKIIPRAIQLLDNTPTANLGSDDIIHGEAGDDEIYGMTGNDVIFGEGQDDNLIGGQGSDRLYGGTGEDGILGDDGQILTSRNGQTEPLYGLTTPNLEQLASVPDTLIGAYVNLNTRLKKEVHLSAFNTGGNDLIYGGLGDDFLHGGAGDDGISGAEALTTFYHANPITNINPLGYNPVTRKFSAYNTSNPRQKIDNFLLNFEATDIKGNKINDGKDSIFGDLGNDWLVGGTGRDRLFGGAGNDLLNADDNLETNNQPDSSEFADADFAFGGSEHDILIANTGKDRLIDWFNDCNTYVVPFELLEPPTVALTPSPEMGQFLLQLAKASGADSTRTEPDGELGLNSENDPDCPPGDPSSTIPGVPVDSLGSIEDGRQIKI